MTEKSLLALEGAESVGGNITRFDGKERVLLARFTEGELVLTEEGEAALKEVPATKSKKAAKAVETPVGADDPLADLLK